MLYHINLKNDRMTAIVNRIGSAGVVELLAADGTTVLVSLPLTTPAGTVSSGTVTFSGMPISAAATAAGIATTARIKNTTNNEVCISGLTVGTTGTNVIIDNSNIAVSQTCILNSLVITHA